VINRCRGPAQAVLTLITRVAIGVVFIAHGWQKVHTDGLGATAKGFDALGIPASTVSAWYAGLVELVGGIALIVGLALPLFGVLLFLDMAGAFYFVHASHGLFAESGGYEYVLVLGLASLLVGLTASTLSLDALLLRRFRPAAVSGEAAEAVG
jgi:putative oxidoreductase